MADQNDGLDTLTGPGLKLWNSLEETDVKFAKDFNRGGFSGTAVDALSNIKRLSDKLGSVGFQWGWRVKSERLDTFGVGEDAQTIHTCVAEAWFRQPDGSKEYVEHVGHTKAAYWTRARRPGEKSRYIVDEEFGKKSLTDALSKIMVSLGASADIWLGLFDANKYVRSVEPDDRPGNGHDARNEERSALDKHAAEILKELREAADREQLLVPARKIKGTFGSAPFWPQIVQHDRDTAAELQALVRAKASAFTLDLSVL